MTRCDKPVAVTGKSGSYLCDHAPGHEGKCFSFLLRPAEKEAVKR